MRKDILLYCIALGWLFFAVLTAVHAVFQFRREHALASEYAVAAAKVVKVSFFKTKGGGCSTNVWVEFQPPGSHITYTYHEPWNTSSSSVPIGFLDSDNTACNQTDWKVGDTIDLAYVPSNPALNRPFWGKLSMGIEPREWKLSIGGSIFCALFAAASVWVGRRERKAGRA